jgi:hypothetical protein
MSQLTYRYLASNQVGLIADLANNITEYRPVYQRTLQLYRGIDNTIAFEIKNSDHSREDWYHPRNKYTVKKGTVQN